MTSSISADGLPRRIPIFPLDGALMLPRGTLPLNIFELRYLDMVRDAMAGERLIGMVQRRDGEQLYGIGGLGRINQFTETDDGRFMIVLAGLTRFRTMQELSATTAYRQIEADYSDFLDDSRQPTVLDATSRQSLEEVLRAYLDAEDLSADWESIHQADDESLVNTLSAVCPFDTAEKQALLEAEDLPRRAATLEALMRFAGDSLAPGSRGVH